METKLESKLLPLKTGQKYSFDTNKKTPDDPYIYYTDKDSDEYIASKLKNVSYDRAPNTYDPKIYALLNFLRA